MTEDHNASIRPRESVLRPVNQLQRNAGKCKVAQLRKLLQAWIDVIVSADSHHRGDLAQSLEHLGFANISCVENRLDSGKDLQQLTVEKTVGI